MKPNHSKTRARLARLLDNITPPEEHLSTYTAAEPPNAVNGTTGASATPGPVEGADTAPDDSLHIAPFAQEHSDSHGVHRDVHGKRVKGVEVTESTVNTTMGADEEDRSSVHYSDDGVYYAGNAHGAAAGSAMGGSAADGPAMGGSAQATAITIKGRADGVLIEVGRGSWNELMAQLTERLRQAAGFFRGGKVTLNVGLRPLQEDELRQVRGILDQFGMTLGVIRSASEQTCQLALAFGLAASLDAPDGLQAQPAPSNHETLQHFVYRGNLRSGQVLRRRETVLVLGDVNPGSQVISHGDILVWGRLRGIAHAGATGDEQAIISALSMEPTQLRIAGLIAILPGADSSIMDKWFGRQTDERRPEIAYVADEQIFVESWDESKPGGIMAFRR